MIVTKEINETKNLSKFFIFWSNVDKIEHFRTNFGFEKLSILKIFQKILYLWLQAK